MAKKRPNDPEDGSSALPEGKRVVRKGNRDGAGGRQTVYLRNKQRNRERPKVNEARSGVGVREQVDRLKQAEQSKEAEKPVEQGWGTGTRTSTARMGASWLLLRIGAVMVPIMIVLLAFMLTRGGKKTGDAESGFDWSEPTDRRELPYDPTGPVAWFNEYPHEAYEGAVGVLDKFNELAKGELPRGLVRNQSITLQRIDQRGGLGWESPFFTKDHRKLNWSTSKIGQTGFIVVSGRHEDQSKFHVYFVKTSSGLQLDWEASTGWSEIALEELPTASSVQNILIRCALVKEPHFDFDPDRLRKSVPPTIVVVHPEPLSWYLLRGSDPTANIWGWVPKNSKLDQELRKLFDFGRIVLERKEEVRVVLKVSKSPLDGTKENEFRIDELLTEDWVLPDEKSLD